MNLNLKVPGLIIMSPDGNISEIIAVLRGSPRTSSPPASGLNSGGSDDGDGGGKSGGGDDGSFTAKLP